MASESKIELYSEPTNPSPETVSALGTTGITHSSQDAPTFDEHHEWIKADEINSTPDLSLRSYKDRLASAGTYPESQWVRADQTNIPIDLSLRRYEDRVISERIQDTPDETLINETYDF